MIRCIECDRTAPHATTDDAALAGWERIERQPAGRHTMWMRCPECSCSAAIAALLSPDPCIVRGCPLDYGHEGAHTPHVHTGPNYTGQFTDCCGNPR